MRMETIHEKIYEIRGQKVMLDFDLALLYGVETKRLKEAVRRNINRFEGEDFMFELNSLEVQQISRTQNATLNIKRGQNIKYAPFAFTELGVAMLSSILNSSTAIEINRAIMRTFVTIRQSLMTNPDAKIAELRSEFKALKAYLEEVFMDQNDINEDTRMQIELINQSLVELQANIKFLDKPRIKIGYI